MQGVHALLVFPLRFKTIALSLIFTPRTAYAVPFALGAGRFITFYAVADGVMWAQGQ